VPISNGLDFSLNVLIQESSAQVIGVHRVGQSTFRHGPPAGHEYAQVLGIKTAPNIFPTGKEFNTAVHNRQVNSIFNSGITSDYPHPEGYLVQGYASSQADGKGLNNGDYKSAEYDAILSRAASKTDQDEAMRMSGREGCR